MKLKVGNTYKWKYDEILLIFLGKYRGWNQFSLVGSEEVWCEVLDSDLHLMEGV